MMQSFRCLDIDGRLQLWKQQSWWKSHRKPSSSLSFVKALCSFKMIKSECRWKANTAVSEAKGKPWKFYSPWKTGFTEGRVGGRVLYPEVTGVEFWTSQTHFRIGSMLLLVLGYGKLLSEGIYFLPLKWFFFLILLLPLLQVSCLRRVTSSMWQCFPGSLQMEKGMCYILDILHLRYLWDV